MSTARDQKIEQGLADTRAQSTLTLVGSLITLEQAIPAARAAARRTRGFVDVRALSLVLHWTLEVLEERHPETAAAIEKAFAETPDDVEIDYVAVVIAAIPESALQPDEPDAASATADRTAALLIRKRL